MLKCLHKTARACLVFSRQCESVRMMHGEPAGEPRRKQSKEESGEGVNTVLPPSSALVARRAPPRRRAPVKSAPDLFPLKGPLAALRYLSGIPTLPVARLSATSVNFHHIFYPSTSALPPSLTWVHLIFPPRTPPVFNFKFPPKPLSLRSHLYSLWSPPFSKFDHSFDSAS